PETLLRVEHASELRPHTEDVEEVFRYRHAAETLGFARSAHQVVAHAVEREVAANRGHRLRPLPQVLHVIPLRGLTGQAAAVAVGDPDELLRLGKGQGGEI